MAEQALQPIEIDVDVGKALKRPYQAKLTPKKRELFFEHYTRTQNETESAQAVGVTRQAIQWLKKNDEKFANAYEAVKWAIRDKLYQTRLSVAMLPSRDGHQDAKMMLKALDPATFGDKLQVDNKQTLRIEVSMPELKRILQGNNIQKADEPEAIPDAEFEVVS